jgi:acyl dehydratase
VFDGRDTINIHTDDETARRAGLPRAVAQGRYPIAYLSEYALAFFGLGWLRGGRIDVRLAKPIFPGDTIAVKARVADRSVEGASVRVELDVWLENQHGECVTAGAASGLVAAPAEFLRVLAVEEAALIAADA